MNWGSDSQTTMQGMRILVVEDEPDSRQAVQGFLEFRGHHVAVAECASDAIALADEIKPEVLVCDWKLNGKRDGIDVASHVQSRYGVPVILITGHRLEQARQKAREARVEVVAYKRKPMSLNDLAELVESLETPKQA